MTKKRWILFCVTTAVLLLVCIIVALSGCADSSTKGNVKEIEAPVRIDIKNNYGTINLDPSLGFDTDTGAVAQDTRNRSDLNPATDVRIPIADGAASAVTGAAENLSNRLDRSWQDNSITEQPRPITPPELTPGDDIDGPQPTGKKTAEQYTLHYSQDRGRQVTWLKHPADYYGFPVTFKLAGPCDGEFVFTSANPKKIGSTSFTVVDDFHYGADNPKAAEVLAPKSCEGPAELTVTFYKND